MAKVLVYYAGLQNPFTLDEAIEQYSKGNEIFLLGCDEEVRICAENPLHDKRICDVCKFFQKRICKRYLPDVKLHKVYDFVTNEIKKEAIRKYKYNCLEDIRKIEFHNVPIGLGTVSSYVSSTRNMTPNFSSEFCEYIDDFLYRSAVMTLVIEKLHKKYKFDRFLFFNGRLANYKPMLSIAQMNKIDFICTEEYVDSKGLWSKDYYYNDTPHNYIQRQEKMERAWKEAKEKGIDCETIGKSFYERRRGAKGTGDKIYITLQEEGKIVDGWDDSKENIVIFNSSEDEITAAGGDIDKYKLFPYQIDGIKAIAEHYKEDKTKHFYLRVHPNLIPVKSEHHLGLYKLNYPNLTVIPADSPISSYALLDKADKVVTFGSSMGIEATYAHKPSISAGFTYYRGLNVAYNPKNLDELWKLIETKDLKDKYCENVLVYGYYLMGVYYGIIHDYSKHLDVSPIKCKVGPYNHVFLKCNTTLFGNTFTYAMVKGLLHLIVKIFPAKFKCIPQ